MRFPGTIAFFLCALGACVPRHEIQRTAASIVAADSIRVIERRRLVALVAGDTATAARFTAPDFQLVTPVGASLTRDQYLGGIASGAIDYLRWEPEEIEVRFYGEAAVIRYRSRIEVTVDGHRNALRPHWHTDLYERRQGTWQVVWSQATFARE